MARVRLDINPPFVFSTNSRIRVGDLNYGNHMSNEVVLQIAHESRVQFLNNIGGSELDIFGVSMIMADAAVEYLSEGFHGDELHINIAVAEISRVSFELLYLIENTTRERILAKVKTGLVCFDYKTRKIQPIPDKLRRALMA